MENERTAGATSPRKKLGTRAITAITCVVSVLIALCVFLMIWYLGDDYPDFTRRFTKESAIPGLAEGFMPQGAAEYDGTTYISGYMADGSPSRIYAVDEDGEAIGYVTVKNDGGLYNGHACGIATNGNRMWLVSDGTVYVLQHKDVKTQSAVNGTVEVSGTWNAHCNADFCYYDGTYFYVGEFYRKGNYETEMPYSYEKYYEASDGDSVVLTLDTTVQYYLEKNMESAIERYDVQNGAFGLVMDVKTGEILAMSTLGSYDPNNYLEIGDGDVQTELDQLQQAYLLQPEGSAAYEEAKAAYDEALVEARLAQWRNRVVSDGYEPGSTFKIITMAAALEEGTTTVNDSFYCGGSEMFSGRSQPLHCWRHEGHGAETTAQALQNSCNLALAHIGLDLGGAAFYEYVQAFGLLETTGVGMSGESAGYFFSEDTITNPNANGYDAAVIASSFGQTFEVTPIQLVRAIAAVVNGGYLMQPYIVSQVLDAGGNVVEQTEPTAVRQVISEETSAIMREMILSVVEEGTAGNAKIAGYAIGGKTGTAEKTGQVDEEGNAVDDKIVSFVGIAPMDDPQYIVLVALDTPSEETGIYISGGVMAAPTVRGVMEDILPYLGVSRDLTEVDMSSVEVDMPDLAGCTESEAAKQLAEASLTYEVVGEGDTVTGQIPAAGAKLPGESEVILYMGEETPTEMVAVPNFTGMTISQAHQAAANAGLYVLARGADDDGSYVTATDQDVAAGTQVVPGTTIRVDFTDHTAQD